MFPITCTFVFESCTATSVFASPRVVVFGFVIVVSVSVNASARVVDGIFMISLGGVLDTVVAVTGVVARGGYCHILAIWVCAVVKGMVFKQFTLG